jgi:hypothetical protein
MKYTILLLKGYCQHIEGEVYFKCKNNIEMKRRRLFFPNTEKNRRLFVFIKIYVFFKCN